jgi:5-methylcytosine-specific restriction endonuclease McrA
MGTCSSFFKKPFYYRTSICKKRFLSPKSKNPYTPPYKKKTIPKSVKKAVWDIYIGKEKGVFQCLCCNHQEIRQIDFHCGHIIAESNGGTTTVGNLRPICSQCNLSMGKMDMYEFKNLFFPDSPSLHSSSLLPICNEIKIE